jgi:hypothetical protein
MTDPNGNDPGGPPEPPRTVDEVAPARPPTAPLDAAGGAPAPRAPLLPTVVDEPELPAETDPAEPWAAQGRTQPGEPPLMDLPPPPNQLGAPGYFQPAAPYRGPLPNASPPVLRPRGTGQAIWIAVLLGGSLLIMAVAVVVAMAYRESSDSPQPVPSETAAVPVATVAPEVVAPTVEEPLPAVSPPPKATAAATTKPKPKASAEPKGTAEPEATAEPKKPGRTRARPADMR